MHRNTKEENPTLFIITCMLLIFFAFNQLDILSTIAIPIMHKFNIGPERISYISSLGLYSNFIVLIFCGPIADLNNPWRFIQVSLIAETMILLILAIHPSITSFTLYRILTGILVGITFPICMKISATIYPKQIGVITGLFGLAAMGGGIAAQTPIIFFLKYINIQDIFAILSIFALLVLIIMQLNTSALKVSKNQLAFKLSFSPLLSAIKKYNNWFLAFYASLINLPIFILGDLWGVTYLTQIKALTALNASITISMIFIGHIIGAISFGYFSDKHGYRKAIVLSCSLIACLTLMLIIIFNIQYTETLALLFFILGVSTSGQVIAFSFAPLSNSKGNKASAVTIISMCSVLIGGIAQHFSGFILKNSHASHYRVSYNHYSFSLIIGLLIIACFISAIFALFSQYKSVRLNS